MCSNTNKRKLILCANTNYYCTKRQDFISYDEEDLIKKVGCLSHPQAWEYLTRDVVEELELQKYIKPFDEESRVWNEAMDMAIALIKGGERR